MIILGWIMIVIGILFVLVGFGNAVKTVFPPTMGLEGEGGGVDIIKAITELIKALTAAPMWLGSTAVGCILIYFGTRLASGLSFF